jgi:hypothetical protein
MKKIFNGYHTKNSDYRFPTPENLESILEISAFPVYMGCTSDDPDNDIHVDMSWIADSNTIKVVPLLPPEIIYPFSHNDSIGQLWSEHHKSFGKFISKHAIGDEVYEIGGAHGLAYVYTREHRKLNWTLHDINPITVPEYDQRVISGKFSKETYAPTKKTKTIVHSHTLEHVNDPISFMSDISLSQEIGSMQIISVPDMDIMLKRFDLNFLNFEHNFFLPEKLLKNLFDSCGYKVVDDYNFNQHSRFYALEKISNEINLVNFLKESYFDIEMFETYVIAVRDYVARINKLIEKSEFPSYVFGAHVFTQMLIGFGLKVNLINGCIDNSEKKQGLRLYGTQLKVFSAEEVFQKQDKVNIFGAVANYTDEIDRGLQKWKNQINEKHWFLGKSVEKKRESSE